MNLDGRIHDEMPRIYLVANDLDYQAVYFQRIEVVGGGTTAAKKPNSCHRPSYCFV